MEDECCFVTKSVYNLPKKYQMFENIEFIDKCLSFIENKKFYSYKSFIHEGNETLPGYNIGQNMVHIIIVEQKKAENKLVMTKIV